ncbi:MAG: UDP-N-acetylmuramate--L-alanine ligase [Wenzhouxiangellaceae bacterium]
MNAGSGFMRRVRQIHFVGIGGAGMSGIAEVLLNLGYTISGSDLVEGETVQRLRDSGANIAIGHAAANIRGADVLVVSTAVSSNNPEVVAAHEQRIPVVPRAEMLGELMRFREGVAVAGTHGKTTTTSLTASLLAEAGMDPTFIIGGLVNAFGSHARLGQGRYVVAEADESDGSFLLLQPVVAVVTNIDRDHMEHYEGSFRRLREAFLEYLHHLPFYGLAVLNIDDDEVRDLLTEVGRPVLTYGFADDADVRADNIRQQGLTMTFDLHLPQHEPLTASIQLPGAHNVHNALGAAAVAWELGVPVAKIISGLAAFAGIGRRFAGVGELPLAQGAVTVIEDYGHHPTELAATLQAARGAWPQRRLVAVFQPHRYSRTHDLFDEFARVLSVVDVLVVTDIYAAGEAPLEGVSSPRLCQAVRSRGRVEPVYVPAVRDIPRELPALLQADDVVLLLGAGDIGQLAADMRAHGWGAGS